ncbi:MAG: glycosyltransferase [Treponema sp.]|nr:glycosyltransferase [Treponema sp.]
MKIAIFIADIEFRTGGTESYFTSLFQCLQNLYPNAEFSVVTTYIPEEQRLTSLQLSEKLNKSYGTNIKSNFNILHVPFKHTGGLTVLKVYKWYKNLTKKFDMSFNCTRNLMISAAKINYSIMHFPMESHKKLNFIKRNKLFILFALYYDFLWKKAFDCILCNSKYTASWLKKIWKISDRKIRILYPPINLLTPGIQKKRQILVCSRVEPSKSIHVLIDAYLKLNKQDVSLIITGAKLPEDEKYYNKLCNLAGNANIIWRFNPTRNELADLYKESLIFWHAKGFEVSEDEHPDLLEHFGMTTVEAMSAGCIPIVVNKGGQREIVDEGVNGFKWDSIDELVEKTSVVLNLTNTDFLRENAINKSKDYSYNSFTKNLEKYIGETKK